MKRFLKRMVVAMILIPIIIVALLFLPNRLATRSGVTDAQVEEVLPGDEIFPDPAISIDRATRLPVSAQIAWPWIVQLGSHRGGWYAPMWLENALNLHSASTPLAQFQSLTVGEIVPDFGPGRLKVLGVAPGRYIAYGSIAGPTKSHFADPAPDLKDPRQYRYTWTFMLEQNTDKSTTLHIRFRAPKMSKGFVPPGSLPGLIDYAADKVMFIGLKEKLAENHKTLGNIN